MTLKIYFASGSPAAWRVMLALVHKGVEFESQEIHFSKGDSRTPEYLALNPHGQVPVLQDGDLTFYESGAMLSYLERKYPGKPLFGETLEENALIMQRMLEVENHVLTMARPILRPLFSGAYHENKTVVDEGIAKMPEIFNMLDGWLGDKKYLTGSKISAADVTLYPGVALVQRVFSGPAAAGIDMSNIVPLSSKAPRVAAWMGRMEAMPGFDSVYPTHWKQAA